MDITSSSPTPPSSPGAEPLSFDLDFTLRWPDDQDLILLVRDIPRRRVHQAFRLVFRTLIQQVSREEQASVRFHLALSEVDDQPVIRFLQSLPVQFRAGMIRAMLRTAVREGQFPDFEALSQSAPSQSSSPGENDDPNLRMLHAFD